MPKFELETNLPVNPDFLSTELLQIPGVNYELGPVLRMSAPTVWAEKPISDWPVDEEIFTSRVLLLGFIPIDFHQFRFVTVCRTGFKESSKSLLNRNWVHERNISASPNGALVKDTVSYESKFGLLDGLFKPVYRAIFSYRHKRLKQKYS